MLLLDTCALVFDALAPKRLSAKARATIEREAAAGSLAVSDISLWEIAMLVERGRLDPGTDAASFCRLALRARNLTVLPITIEIAVRSVALSLHGDPADRLIAATAIEHRATLVTTDERLLACADVSTLK
ncbi:MAG: type II toxin-antitoxin system VapC family toxin [Deltaproteobacteria bacterium]|nr:type II toxin-antitoxin system VapC family toxin [Deltaproteobacteria bacterium]